MKLVLKIASIGVLGLVLLVVAFSLAVNPLLGKVLRAGVTRATGTETTLASVDLGLVSGRLELAGFAIANPEGFRDEPFLALEDGRVSVATSSLFSDTVEVRTLELSGVVLNVEARGTSTNYGALIEHMRQGSAGGEPSGEPGDGARKTLAIDRIVVTDIACALHLDVPLADGSGTIRVPEVVIEDFRSDGTTAANVAKLTRALVEALLDAVLEAGGGILPGALLGDLREELGDLGETLEGTLGDVKDRVEDAVEDVGGRVKDILGGKKED